MEDQLSTINHTYLRYECADTFGISVASGSSKAPASHQVVVNGRGPSNPLLYTIAGSTINVWNVKSSLQPIYKIGHVSTDSIGSGSALNDNEVVCVHVSEANQTTSWIATGWIDGTVRIFECDTSKIASASSQPPFNSLLDDRNSSSSKHRLWQSDPLVLNGHASPVRTITMDGANRSRTNSRCASGGSDGSIILWDIIAETGLFRFLGHRAGISDLSFLSASDDQRDLLISCSLDGLIKIWDIANQCCIQTLTSYRGHEVLTGALASLTLSSSSEEDHRFRFITGGSNGQTMVWSMASSSFVKDENPVVSSSSQNENSSSAATDPLNPANHGRATDDILQLMGYLKPPEHVAVSASDKIMGIRMSSQQRYVGILRGEKSLDVYSIRSLAESHKKKLRRLKRRQEKLKKKQKEDGSQEKSTKTKRGLLDDDESDGPANEDEEMGDNKTIDFDPELLQASDEFEYLVTIRTTAKIRGFCFYPKDTRHNQNVELCRIVCALGSNALETYVIQKRPEESSATTFVVVSERVNNLDFYGHPTGIRSIALSSNDRLACTVSKNVSKIWNTATRVCIQSSALSIPNTQKGTASSSSRYGLCTAFLPGDTHVVIGTREGDLLLMDLSSGELVFVEQKAHDGAIWSIDVRRPPPSNSQSAEAASMMVVIVSGSADKTVKFWNVEAQDVENTDAGDYQEGQPMLVHTRTLQMTDDVISVKYSHSFDPTRRMVFVSTLDSTVKVFFDDSLKLFLSLYGHKLPALAMDCSDDDVLLASGGADKTIKIWGLDFGDTHRTLHGHDDSITDLRFVRRTHQFFTSSKDGTVRYWDGDRFEQILLFSGHCAEVNCLAVSRTGAFVLSGGMDRQIRVWERTKDIVFLEEERERELEKIFDRVNSNREEESTGKILDRKQVSADNDDEDIIKDDEPQSEAAVRKSVLSVAGGDRIMEALERANQELKEIAAFRKAHGADKKRSPNLMMLSLEPAPYILWVLRTIKSAEVEQSLVLLSLRHVERLMYYLIQLLKTGQGVELCSRVAVFLVKAHQNQIIATKTLVPPLRELKRLIRMRVAEMRDVAGVDLAALKLLARAAQERQQSRAFGPTTVEPDVWAGLGLGSDVAAALQGQKARRK